MGRLFSKIIYPWHNGGCVRVIFCEHGPTNTEFPNLFLWMPLHFTLVSPSGPIDMVLHAINNLETDLLGSAAAKSSLLHHPCPWIMTPNALIPSTPRILSLIGLIEIYRDFGVNGIQCCSDVMDGCIMNWRDGFVRHVYHTGPITRSRLGKWIQLEDIRWTNTFSRFGARYNV